MKTGLFGVRFFYVFSMVFLIQKMLKRVQHDEEFWSTRHPVPKPREFQGLQFSILQ